MVVCALTITSHVWLQGRRMAVACFYDAGSSRRKNRIAISSTLLTNGISLYTSSDDNVESRPLPQAKVSVAHGAQWAQGALT